jgi:hypothetical protein
MTPFFWTGFILFIVYIILYIIVTNGIPIPSSVKPIVTPTPLVTLTPSVTPTLLVTQLRPIPLVTPTPVTPTPLIPIYFVFENIGFNYSVQGFANSFPTLTVIKGKLYHFNVI